MNLIITIDTEEDNWNSYSRTDNPCKNIEKLIPLQKMFDNYNIKPTYLISYPVATDKKAISILTKFIKEDKCEIGTHCHPWNTPPLEEKLNKKNTMLCNLPYELILKKIKYLHETIVKNFNIVPSTFRAGRFGLDNKVASVLLDLNYKIDTSITPYENQVSHNGPDFSEYSLFPFKFLPEEISESDNKGVLFEIPPTSGFLQKNYDFSKILNIIVRKKYIKNLRLVGILDKLHLLNWIRLNPENSSVDQMIKLTKVLIKKDVKIINMMFHSTTLMPGLNGFVKNTMDEKRFITNIENFLNFTQDSGIKSIKLSDCISNGII
jgi:hypothetical protein